jgi:hypothetical protein
MTTNGREHQLPIKTVKEGLDVEVENPVEAPAASRALATASMADLPGR